MAKTKKIKRLSQNKGQLSREMGLEQVLRYIYEYPNLELTVRTLASKTGLSKSTIQRHLIYLREIGIIGSDYKFLDTWKNKFKKSQFYLNKIIDSGLVEFISEKYVASTIILFGSFSKGDSTKESDIDLFVEGARNVDVSLQHYEKILGHKIQLFTRTKITQLPKHLLNNVINGAKLWGHYTIK